ncbi:MAG: hypothetical protein K7J15_04810 [Candidatus Regiella insecticola]|nr:hypothetical protein [Candidatus Regiella insecticola]
MLFFKSFIKIVVIIIIIIIIIITIIAKHFYTYSLVPICIYLFMI